MLWARTFPTKPYDLSQLQGELISVGANNAAWYSYGNAAHFVVPVVNNGSELYEFVLNTPAGAQFFSGTNFVNLGGDKFFVDSYLNLVNGEPLQLSVGSSLGTIVFPQLSTGEVWITRLV
jgi:hypothetical protein